MSFFSIYDECQREGRRSPDHYSKALLDRSMGRGFVLSEVVSLPAKTFTIDVFLSQHCIVSRDLIVPTHYGQELYINLNCATGFITLISVLHSLLVNHITCMPSTPFGKLGSGRVASTKPSNDIYVFLSQLCARTAFLLINLEQNIWPVSYLLGTHNYVKQIRQWDNDTQDHPVSFLVQWACFPAQPNTFNN